MSRARGAQREPARPVARPPRRSARRLRPLLTLGALAAGAALLVALAYRAEPAAVPAAARGGDPARPGATPSAPGTPRTPQGSLQAQFAVGLRVLRLVDATRTIRLPDGRSELRPLVTYVRYPALGGRPERDISGAQPARGPFPLVVFGHGYALAPARYARLLRAWAAAGYVVAAPVFPLENEQAPGGPNEADLVNQPADMRFVIARLLAANTSAANPLRGLIDPTRIAVAGHSDGGETAFAVAYDRSSRDRRVRAAVILAGAELSGARAGALVFPPGSPPLLAAQGTADTINPPSFTLAFYSLAPRPKFLLTLPGAAHLAPYAYEQPQLGVVERVTIAFLDRYLKGGSLRRLLTAAGMPGVARLSAVP